jgi:hypothetical protein
MSWLARVDTTNGKIIGADKGTLTYLHEQNHLYYNNHPLYGRLSLSEEHFKTLALIFIIIAVTFESDWVLLGSVMAILISIGLNIFEEVMCWVWAIKKNKD